MGFQKLSADVIRQHKGVSFTGITTVFFCHDGKGRLFLTKRSKNTRDEHGRWDPGGGGLKHGQAIEENMRREVKEEYNADIIKSEFLGYFDAFRPGPEGLLTHWLAMCFAVQIDPSQVKINEPDMVDDSGWFSIDNLPKPMHSQFETFYKKHGQKLKEILDKDPN
jgi:8-oxo-dGTP diphosphatase